MDELLNKINNIVDQYNLETNNMCAPIIPKSKKSFIRKQINNGKLFVGMFDKEENIPDNYFTRYIDNNSEIIQYILNEVRKYTNYLHLNLKEGEIDISNVINSTKCSGMTYIESLNRLYSNTDSVDYEDRTIEKHLKDLRTWFEKNNREICLWDTNYLKIGNKYYINNFNGNHLNTLCKLIQISNKADSFGLPDDFNEKLKHVKARFYNTPDDIEFILLFNKIKEMNLGLDFKLISDEQLGTNIIKIENYNTIISNKYELLRFIKDKYFRDEKQEEFSNGIIIGMEKDSINSRKK